jgi:hypothetical protein
MTQNKTFYVKTKNKARYLLLFAFVEMTNQLTPTTPLSCGCHPFSVKGNEFYELKAGLKKLS